MASDYKYDRPLNGQPEERWFQTLSLERQQMVAEETRLGLALRRDAWNAKWPASRRIPRDG